MVRIVVVIVPIVVVAVVVVVNVVVVVVVALLLAGRMFLGVPVRYHTVPGVRQLARHTADHRQRVGMGQIDRMVEPVGAGMVGRRLYRGQRYRETVVPGRLQAVLLRLRQWRVGDNGPPARGWADTVVPPTG